ncbi:MAG: hypothetical protein ACJ8AT_02000 [Hyalangium sp.]|uniref:hypothetical protein n=1 Tax=Hyalangium sp. TaxID=2028555 RepID=UPI00389B246F
MLGSLFTGGVEQPSPELQACHSQQAALLLRCLHELPEKFRLVVLLEQPHPVRAGGRP